MNNEKKCYEFLTTCCTAFQIFHNHWVIKIKLHIKDRYTDSLCQGDFSLLKRIAIKIITQT